MKKRIISIILLLLTVFFAAGCENVTLDGESSAITEDSLTSDEYTEEESADEWSQPPTPEPITEIKLITSGKSGFISDEDTPQTVSSAVKRRNETIENDYRIKLNVTVKTEKEILNDAEAAMKAGNVYSDIISVEADTAVILYLRSSLCDMNTLGGLDLNSDSFSESSKSLATNKTLYLLPDESNLNYDDSVVLFYNRDLIASSEAEDPETLAAEGKWTWDKFNSICRTAAKRVYSITAADMDGDTFGFATYFDAKTHAANMWASTGQKVIKDTYMNDVAISMTVSEVTSYASKLRSVQNTRGRLDYNGDKAEKAFTEGRLVFLETRLSYMYALRDGSGAGENYGFVPMPKYDENQESYSTPTLIDVRVFSVPYQGENPSAAKLSAISRTLTAFAETAETVRKGYTNQFLAQYLRDNTETLLLETVLTTANYDFADIFGSKIYEIRRGASEPVTDYIDFASRIDTSFANSKKQFNDYVAKKFNS